jgi:CRISPR-associated protein Csb2
MLAIEVEFLSGAYVATAFDDRRRPEWPPHPARLFAAFVAAWADSNDPDTDNDSANQGDPTERAALVELEELGAPRILCDRNPSTRSIVDHYVPDNDVTALSRPADVTNLYIKRDKFEHELAVAPPGSKEHTKASQKLQKRLDSFEQQSAKLTSSSGSESPAQIDEVIRVLPEERGLQARTYPTVVPRIPRVRYEWAEANPTQLEALVEVAARVHRIGHSSSFVSCTVSTESCVLGSDDDVRAWLEPTRASSQTQQLRVTDKGMLRSLEASFRVHQGNDARVTPHRMRSYGPQGDGPVAGSVHSGSLVIIPFPPKQRPPINRTVELTTALRGAIMKHCPIQPCPEFISGHQNAEAPSGPSEQTHTAFVALASVGFARAQGVVHGVGLVLAQHSTPDDELVVRDSVARWMAASGRLQFGGRHITVASHLDRVAFSLRASRWMKPARRWATATPIVLDRFPKSKHVLDGAAAVIEESCALLGLPKPAHIQVSVVPVVLGSRPVRGFPGFRTPMGNRPAVHAVITFREPVRGPLLIGAGRYLGMGLCVPLRDHEFESDETFDHETDIEPRNGNDINYPLSGFEVDFDDGRSQ